jgi:hypothetical protein
MPRNLRFLSGLSPVHLEITGLEITGLEITGEFVFSQPDPTGSEPVAPQGEKGFDADSVGIRVPVGSIFPPLGAHAQEPTVPLGLIARSPP